MRTLAARSRSPVKNVVISMQPVAVTREDAATALGMGITMFSERVQPDLKVIRVGAKVLIPTAELQRWAEQNAERTL
jgi:hypothetical protein